MWLFDFSSRKLSFKNHMCPICETENHDSLQASHVGEPIMKKIDKVIEKYYTPGCSFYELFLKVIEEENNSIIAISCRKCNMDLETK